VSHEKEERQTYKKFLKLANVFRNFCNAFC